MSEHEPLLFSPLDIGELHIENRIVMPPMCMYSASMGRVSPWHVEHYAERAKGGAGLIIVEATGVLPAVSLISDADLGIWDDDHIEGLSRIVQAVHAHGARIGIQLNHAGRKCGSLKAKTIYAPSPLRFSDEYAAPAEMTQADIDTVIAAFGDAARRARAAGFDIIEIHAAHGYLISSFLSPLSNARNDVYGMARAMFLKEVLERVRSVVGESFPLAVRISASDWKKGGNEAYDFEALLSPLVQGKLFDLLDVSSGGVDAQGQIAAYPGYQLPFAYELKQRLSIPVIGGGLITDAAMAEEVVRHGVCDAVYIGRELLRNPYWSLQAGRKLHARARYPRQYARSFM